METETSTQQYESRHRLTWAARYPLKPGRDVASRRGPASPARGHRGHRRILGVSREARRAHGSDRSTPPQETGEAVRRGRVTGASAWLQEDHRLHPHAASAR